MVGTTCSVLGRSVALAHPLRTPTRGGHRPGGVSAHRHLLHAGRRRQTVKNRLHLDLTCDPEDRDEEIDRILSLGGRRVDIGQSGGESWTVLADPEGNEFCECGLSRHPCPDQFGS
ncbi:VOC family protein [Kribbella sp. NPDC050241]|uniref:VOC family protein n=1 Tax=Kribbella sp. NPDC050241 TaxID=3364115 RepID=UPI0037976221